LKRKREQDIVEEEAAVLYPGLLRLAPEPETGLRAEEVREREEAGAVNIQGDRLTPSYGRIVRKNTLTLFNIIHLLLAAAVLAVGYPWDAGYWRNILFLGIAVCSSAMGIFQEVRAKRTLDRLSVLAQARVHAVRDGRRKSIAPEELVLDDIVRLSAGDQICADAVVVHSDGLEVDESLLTGESRRIRKNEGDPVLSGSYAAGGQAFVRVTAVGEENYATALTREATRERGHKNKPQLLRTLNLLIRVLTFVIFPLGGLLFYAKYMAGEALETSVLGVTAAMIGMIPEGLVLLTGITLTVGAMNLARRRALVQSLPSIETLARADILCLDKTGTITDGNLAFERMEPQNGAARENIEQAIAELMGTLKDSNATAALLRETFGESASWIPQTAVPFSSDRKWSGATYLEGGSYILGAPNVLLSPQDGPSLELANRCASQGLRVLCLAFSPFPIREAPVGEDTALPGQLRCAALLLLSDQLREDAAETFAFFAREGVALKVISGDNPRTVSAVALRAGLENAEKAFDMRLADEEEDYAALAEEYTVFGHVTPPQKQALVRGLQENGHTVCMTGDGVNDILAMREADCSVAMVGGSDAARSACDFVLLSDNFASMVNVLQEGRRVINNIERVSSLYMVKTVYSVLLSILYVFIPAPYPFSPLQLTPVSAFTVGIPSFLLALQANYRKPANRLGANIVEHSIPAALTIVFNTLYLQLASMLFKLTLAESSTMVAFLMGAVGFYLLLVIAKPYDKAAKITLPILAAGLAAVFLFFGDFFSLASLINRSAFFYLPLLYFSYHIHGFLGKANRKAMDWTQEMWRRRRG